MAHLGMHQAVKHTSINNGASADARAHRQVNEIGEILRRSPTRLAERSSVDVGVETDRHFESIAHGAGKIVVLPSYLGSGGYVAKRQRGAVQVDRPK